MYEPKNIVICLDGTGSQIERDISNVLKFYRCLKKTPSQNRANDSLKNRQVVYYDQGVGTIKLRSTFGGFRQKVWSTLGLITGWGLDRNVLNAYRFIVENYEEHRVPSKNDKKSVALRSDDVQDGDIDPEDPEPDMEGLKAGSQKTHIVRDKIFIFGYSRGAHAARVLAGFIHNMGVLSGDQINLSEAAFTAYKSSKTGTDAPAVREFNRITQPKRPAIDLVGVWETVSSVITPRPDRFYLPMIECLPNTTENMSIKAFRHAKAIDENRYMFRLDNWESGQMFKRHQYSQAPEVLQDSQEVWFSGHHTDVGGANRREDSGIAQMPLVWMIQQANLLGLKFITKNVKYVALGDRAAMGQHTVYEYPEPSAIGKIHPAYKTPWVILEIMPKLTKFREWLGKGKRFNFLFFYIPWWEPRPIPDGAVIHESAVQRKGKLPDYQPKNWPASHKVYPYDNRDPSEWDKPAP